MLNYADVLEAGLGQGDKRKGERTRDRLKAATARLLEQVGYRDLRVTDINETAGVSNALFYVYFKNKEEIAQEVLSEFLVYFAGYANSSERWSSPDASIYHGNIQYVRIFSANSGLMRCLFQFSDEFEEFSKKWSDWNSRWRQRVLNAMRRSESVFVSETDLMLAIAALGTMVDGLLRLILIQKDASLTDAERQLDAEALALFLTRLWVRSLFAREMDWNPTAD